MGSIDEVVSLTGHGLQPMENDTKKKRKGSRVGTENRTKMRLIPFDSYALITLNSKFAKGNNSYSFFKLL